MSVRSILEIVLHVESFRNIDLFYQGLYFLKFNIYMENNDQKIFAHPYCLTEAFKTVLENSQNKGSMKFGDNQFFKQAMLTDNTSSFLTKAFFIRFCEEEIDLNDFCHFRIEFDVKPKYETIPLYMEVELMFQDCLSNGNVNNVANMENTKENNEINEKLDSKSLASAKFRIKNAMNGVHEFVPVVFEEQHFSLVNVVFHSVLLDYRFRVSPLQLSTFAKLNLDEKTLLNDPNILMDDNLSKNQKNNAPCASFYEYLTKYFNKNTIDYEFIKENFVMKIRNTYEKLYDHYNYVSSKAITDKQKKQFKKYLQPPMKLIIPEYINKENSNNPEARQEYISKFNENLKSKDSEILCNTVLNEVNFISGQIFQLWHKFLELLKISPRFVSAIMQYEYDSAINERWGEFILRKVIKTTDFTSVDLVNQNIGESHKLISNQTRNKYANKIMGTLNIENSEMFPKTELQPIIFEQVYSKESKDKFEENIADADAVSYENDSNNYKGIHLFVLVHGFQGNSYDMKLLKNHMNYLHPEAMFLCSNINEDNTEGDIADMGEKLANEVITFICDNCPSSSLGRISFIGHSLGGLIIRAALPHLEEYADKMFSYFTLSSPHLGYMYTSSKIIEAGIWILQKWRKSQCLTQLSMNDSKNIEDTFLYKLSVQKGLNWFKNVCLISSYQDRYAPFDSARIEVCKEALSDNIKGKLYIQMARNILGNLSTNVLHRIDVNFNIPEKSLDSFIGRAAHILFLESQPLLRMLVHRYDNFFT